jgi:hypothetical protein
VHCQQKQESASRHASIYSAWVFSEDVVLAGLKAARPGLSLTRCYRWIPEPVKAEDVAVRSRIATTYAANAQRWTGNQDLGSGGSNEEALN